MASTDRAVGAHGGDLAPALALAALLAGASLSLARLYQSGTWVLPTWLTMAAALGLAALLRRAGVGQGLALLLELAGFVVVAGILLFPFTLWLVVPTGATVAAMRDAVGVALRSMVEQAAPVTVTREFLLLTCAGAWAVAISADGLTFRARQPLLAIVPALGLFVFPGVIRSATPVWYTLWFLLGVTAMLLIEARVRLTGWGRWVSSPRARPASRWLPAVTPAATTGRRLVLAAGLLALLVPWLLPGYGRPALLDYRTDGGSDTPLAINQFVTVRARLTATRDVKLFSVASPQSSYWRLLTLDRFDGTTFLPSAGRDDVVPFSGDTSRDLVPGAPTTRLTQRIRIEGLRSDNYWLPAAAAPVQVTADQRVYQSRLGRGLAVKGRFGKGFTYTVTSLLPNPQAQDLAGPKSYDGIPGLARYLDTGGVDDRVKVIADTLTRGKPNPFDKALALQDWLRDPKVFSYNLNVPSLARGGDQLVRFLTVVREGYCEQFATAMAVLAREVGIPARVAVGFTPGEPTANGRFEVSARDAHAWPELYFPGVGWVPFEPTPRSDGQAVPPLYTTLSGRQVASPTSPTLAAQGGATPSTAAVPGALREPDANQASSQLGSASRHRSLLARRPVQVALALVVLLLAVPLAKGVRTLLARRRARVGPRDAVAEAYGELAAWTGDAGIGRHAAETPRAYAARMGADFGADATALAELTGLFVAAEYAPAQPGVEQARRARALARAARAALARRLGWRRRLLAALSVRSLLPSPASRR